MKRSCRFWPAVSLGIVLSPVLLASAQGLSVDPATPKYTSLGGVAGNLRSVGSDTMSRLMTAWEEAFTAIHGDVNVEVEAKGSSTAPLALLAGSAQLGPMSREMTPSEIEAFRKKFGYPPSMVRVAVDALAVFVNVENPIKGLTLAQLKEIFSEASTPEGKDLSLWGGLGLSGEWAVRPITLYGRNSASGTHAFFKEVTLGRRNFREALRERPGSGLVVQAVAWDVSGIGYAGVSFKSTGIKPLPIGKSPDKLFAPTAANALNGNYPLCRYLYVYFNKPPSRPADKLVTEFLKFIESKEGQQIVVAEGLFALPASICVDERSKLN